MESKVYFGMYPNSEVGSCLALPVLFGDESYMVTSKCLILKTKSCCDRYSVNHALCVESIACFGVYLRWFLA